MESTLSLKRTDLMSRVGDYLGYGAGLSAGEQAYTTQQNRRLKDFVDSGCRLVYQAGVGGKTYDWSWLRPVAEFVLASGATEILLPEDFGGIEGDLVLVPTSGIYVHPVKVTNPELVRQRLARFPTQTGRPEMAGVEWLKGTTPTTGQRAKLVLFPQADQQFRFRAQYYLLPDALTDQNPYALGGMMLSEVYLEAALAVAEQRLNNMLGVHTQKFQELLAAAIHQDRRLKSETVGYNRDRSDDAEFYFGGRYYQNQSPVAFNGVVYGP